MLNVILNENAAGKTAGKKFEAVAKIFERYEAEYRVYRTEYRRHATEIAAKLALSGADNVVVAGGDGTLNEAVAGLFEVLGEQCLGEVAVGILPLGTGNDFVRSAGLPTDAEEAAKIILAGSTRLVDVADVGGVKMVCFSNAGIDADVVDMCNREKHKKTFSYAKNAIKCILRGMTYDFTVCYDGKEESFSGIIASVVNGKSMASGMNYAPSAKVDDGLLDLVAVEKAPRLKLLKTLWKLATNRPLNKSDKVRYAAAKRFEISAGTTVVDIDGELYTGLDYTAECLEKCLKIYAKSGD